MKKLINYDSFSAVLFHPPCMNANSRLGFSKTADHSPLKSTEYIRNVLRMNDVLVTQSPSSVSGVNAFSHFHFDFLEKQILLQIN